MSRGKVVAGATAAGVLALAALLVKPWEGYEPEPYRDVVGVWTVCYGHTGRSSGVDIERRPYSREECDRLLESDMGVALDQVLRCINQPATDYQLAALVSATYNAGPRIVCGSTLQRKANAGDWHGACAELDRWVYADGRKLKGLVRRRAAERAMCEGR